jgi:hypothetical protein
MDKKDKLSASLQKNLPIKKPSQVYIDKKDIKDDYEYSRKTYKDLIDTGVRSLDVLAELARESEHPRAFEVLSKTIKDIGDTTEKLMDLQKSKKEINKVEAEEKKQKTNKKLFVGSTTELQKKKKKENERIIYDAEDKE